MQIRDQEISEEQKICDTMDSDVLGWIGGGDRGKITMNRITVPRTWPASDRRYFTGGHRGSVISLSSHSRLTSTSLCYFVTWSPCVNDVFRGRWSLAEPPCLQIAPWTTVRYSQFHQWARLKPKFVGSSPPLPQLVVHGESVVICGRIASTWPPNSTRDRRDAIFPFSDTVEHEFSALHGQLSPGLLSLSLVMF
jgi:hypothetical protein